VSDRVRLLALAVAAAGGAYVLTLLAAPLVDRSIDILRAHPEDYAGGPAQTLVVAGYWSVALMALLIAAALVAGDWRDRLASALLLAGALTSVSLAIVPVPVTGGVLLIGVLGFAVAPAALALAHASGARTVRVLGAAVFLLFLALVFAPAGVAGLTNRLFDIALGSWGLALGLHRYGEQDVAG